MCCFLKLYFYLLFRKKIYTIKNETKYCDSLIVTRFCRWCLIRSKTDLSCEIILITADKFELKVEK